MKDHRFWPPRFGLRGLMLFVLTIAVALTVWDGRRRAHDVNAARAQFERLMLAWRLGVVPSEEIIEASQDLFAAERRQRLSSFYNRAIVDSNVLRLTRIRDDLRHAAEHFRYASEEGTTAAWQDVNELSRLIDEAEQLAAQD